MVDLGEMVPAEWTRMQILTPYMPPAVVDSVLGFEWRDGRHERLEMRDDINVLAFVNRGSVVRYVAFPRHRGDFCCLGYDASGGRGAAKFVAVADGLSGRVMHNSSSLSADCYIFHLDARLPIAAGDQGVGWKYQPWRRLPRRAFSTLSLP